MFNDGRSKSVIFVAHCILNHNAISDGTASFPGFINEIVELLSSSDVGIIQLPCPELHCLGLDRGNPHGYSTPIIEENTRIRNVMKQSTYAEKLDQLAQLTIDQILEYRKHGFEIKGIVGINRSPSCGVNSTSKDNQEVAGEGLFIEALRQKLNLHGILINMVGIKAFDTEQAVSTVRKLLGTNIKKK